jgi:hypothetical protein
VFLHAAASVAQAGLSEGPSIFGAAVLILLRLPSCILAARIPVQNAAVLLTNRRRETSSTIRLRPRLRSPFGSPKPVVAT